MTTATAELLPVDYTRSPNGVLHLIPSHPDIFTTLCGESIKTGKGKAPWTIVDETLSGGAATCLPCYARFCQRDQDNILGNNVADEGCDRCVNCGCKYWEFDRCIDCGADWTPEARGEDD